MENTTNYQPVNTFCKRGNGLLKKAYELSVLCYAEVAHIVFSCCGRLHDFAKQQVGTVIVFSILLSFDLAAAAAADDDYKEILWAGGRPTLILLFVVIAVVIILFCFFWSWRYGMQSGRITVLNPIVIEAEPRIGLDRHVIESFPLLTFSSVALGSDCSICLEDFVLGDRLRELPACHHIYHDYCIRDWLNRDTRCPNCRHDYMANMDIEMVPPN